MAAIQPQLDLFADFIEPPSVVQVPKPLLTVVKSEPKPVISYNGYTNSATYSAALYLENSRPTWDALKSLFLAGNLTAKAIESHFNKSEMILDEWAEGTVDWEAFRIDFEQQFREELDQESYPSNVLDALSQLAIEDCVAKLTTQLDRKLWVQLDQILNVIGGRWNKKAKGHVFEEDPTDLIENVILTGKTSKPEKFGYFPTPQPLARNVVDLAEIEQGMTVFEPSAGSGNLCDVIAEFTDKSLISCNELQEKNVKTLVEKGYPVTTGDFMSMYPCGSFDRVVMNPPFEKQQDIKHVMFACDFLKPGGRLVAIMSASFTFRTDKRSMEFREFVEQYGSFHKNPEGSFKSSGTGVNTVTVIIDIPAEEELKAA
jgi:protein-L-isoaspartate O-methyltransferase